ncbi:LLM class flavin-dependent oxidoreductase [Streptomyces sp. A7024]|uniref:LLM class flavin-dependent oxidoreductase n=2 Tax=Streptomyces coryli TaxID=1128680 RepID=A0A6G4U4J1_9ACTN|nr:LLM class flavin-dependent oxidoreductase [Streptomyces coryli]
MTQHQPPVFGVGVSSAIRDTQGTLKLVAQADQQGLDHFSVSDHPYVGRWLDAYATIGFALGRTERISGLVNVTNLPNRPAPMLSRTVTSLSELSGGRIVLGMGVGGSWDDIVKLGPERLSPGQAVRAFEEAIALVRLLSGGGAPVTFEGEFYRVTGLQPAPAAAPPVWTGSVGPKSLAATGRLADGWIPGHAADWRSDRYLTSRPLIDEAAAAAGRDPRDIATVFNFTGAITDTPTAAPRDAAGRWIGGSVAQWVDELTGAVLEHGAAGFTLFAPGGGVPDEIALGRWAEEIAPAVREAAANR